MARKIKRIAASGLQITDAQYLALQAHLKIRLDIAKTMRDEYAARFQHIDREYYCYMNRDADDRKRQRDNSAGKGVKPVDEKLSMIFAQIDEALTYLLTVLAPDDALYSATAPREQQPAATAFSALMNQHAERFAHYRNYALFLLTALKYNFGGFGVFWQSVIGNVPQATTAGTVTEFIRDVISAGNEIAAFDPYNLLLDPSVNPIDIATKGEFFAYVEAVTEFRLRKMEEDGDLVGVVNKLDKDHISPQFAYMLPHPVIRVPSGTFNDGMRVVDWVGTLTAAAANATVQPLMGYELVTMHCWLVPAKFGLAKTTTYSQWKFIIFNGTDIVHAEPFDNAHGMLPCNIAMPWEDFFVWQTPAITERLEPYQRFASHVLNAHQRTTRKKLYGLTYFDPTYFPILGTDEADLLGGKVASAPTAPDVDLRRKIGQFTDGPDTTGTLENIRGMNDIMQQILPTNLQQQVAGLDRATQYQAAAMVQSANRRNLKIAKLINTQAMNNGRTQQYYNILQYQQSVDVLMPDGTLQAVDPRQFRNAKLMFTLSDGLKGLDRLSLILNIKEVLNAVLQSQQASAQLDVVGIIDYWTSMMGDHTDFRQFKIASPLDQLPAEQRNLAFQLLQQYVAQQNAGGGAAGVVTGG